MVADRDSLVPVFPTGLLYWPPSRNTPAPCMNDPAARTLLSVIELLGYPNLRPVFERLGYRVQTEFAVRRAIGFLRKEKPAVIVADFYFQPDFRDRVSNLESLLASVQSNRDVKVLVLYEAAHQHALDRLRQRFRIDAALTLPVDETGLEALLASWRG